MSELSARAKSAVLTLCCAGQFMVILDVSVVNVALPSIRADLGFTVSGLQWVVNAYTVLFAGFLLLGGLRPISELRTKRARGRAANSDADQLARLTGLPGGFWLGAWYVIGLAALVAGGRWLLLIPQL